MPKEVIVLPGDGIGPEIIPPTIELVKAVTDKVEFDERLIGGASIDDCGVPLTDQTLEDCRHADAILLGAVGGPKWDMPSDPANPRPTPEQGLLSLRKELVLYINERPIIPHPALYDRSPLGDRIQGTAFHIVRELTGGIYFGEKTRSQDEATDTCRYTRAEIERIAHFAFVLAEAGSKRVTSVDKANVLETSKLWREVVTEMGESYDVPLEHMLVDNAAMQIVAKPAQFEVILTENLFGDILSDEAAIITGSIGLLPSISLNAEGGTVLCEPVHGSAPDIAGRGTANPIGAFRSASMMLRMLALEDGALAIETAIDTALADGLRTRDLGGRATTKEATATVLSHL